MSEADDQGWIDVSVAQDGGVLKKITKEAPENASGPPPKGDEVTAHYTGKYRLGVVSTK
jgi:hypothetical protein